MDLKFISRDYRSLSKNLKRIAEALEAQNALFRAVVLQLRMSPPIDEKLTKEEMEVEVDYVDPDEELLAEISQMVKEGTWKKP